MITDKPATSSTRNGVVNTVSSPGPAPSKPRRIPKWAVWVGIVAIVGIGWFLWQRSQASKSRGGAMITATVTRGDLIESVSATGSVTAQTGAEVKIGSQITGVIKHLYTDVGSHVKAGELIAQLDLPDLQAQVASTQAQLSTAETKLAQQQTGVGMTNTQVRMGVTQAQAALDSSQAKLRSAQANATQSAVQTPNDIDKAQTSLASAKAALSTAKSGLLQTQTGAALQVATAKNQSTQAQATAANSALNLQRQDILAAKGFVAQMVADQAKATATVDKAAVASAQQNVQLVQQKVTADLQAAKDGVTQAQQNIVAAQAVLKSAKAESYAVQSQRAVVDDALGAEQLATASRAVAVGNLSLITQKQQDIMQAQDAVLQARAQLVVNQSQLDKSYIRSPIAGTVLQMAAQQGETLAAGLSAPTLIIVADLDRLQIDSFIDETDVGVVKVGQPVQVVLDAFPKHTFQGVVGKIASGSTIQNGVVTYDVTVSIHQERQFAMKPDMTASVTIQTGQRTGVLLIPSVAVQMSVRGSTVNVITQQDGQPVIKGMPVTTGGSDGMNTEIVTGLKEGQKIVVAGALKGNAGGPSQSTSPFGSPGRGGGGGGGGRRGG